MKSVLMSIQPKWCELIANGKKTVEIRKTRPKLETPFKVYIYCTSVARVNLDEYANIFRATNGRIDDWHGKVIGEFVCDEIECFTTDYRADKKQTKRISKQSCVSWLEMEEYEINSHCLYGWHITDLVIYDKPRELGEFLVSGNQTFDCPPLIKLKRPPQSWCYVERED